MPLLSSRGPWALLSIDPSLSFVGPPFFTATGMNPCVWCVSVSMYVPREARQIGRKYEVEV